MEVWAWGANNYGQLGIGTKSEQVQNPKRVQLPPECTIEHCVCELVGGLWEVDSTIDTTKFNDEFLKILMNKFGGTLEKNNLSDEEMQLLINRGKKRLEDEEWLLRGNNENFI